MRVPGAGVQGSALTVATAQHQERIDYDRVNAEFGLIKGSLLKEHADR